MMDLYLDSEQGRALDCSTCDPQKMRIRNCNDQWDSSKSPIKVNGKIYRSCPRAIVANEWEVGYLVSLYFECRDNKTGPFGRNVSESTAYGKKLFDYLDSMVSEFRMRENKKQEAERKRAEAKSKIKR